MSTKICNHSGCFDCIESERYIHKLQTENKVLKAGLKKQINVCISYGLQINELKESIDELLAKGNALIDFEWNDSLPKDIIISYEVWEELDNAIQKAKALIKEKETK